MFSPQQLLLLNSLKNQNGKLGYILLWFMGVPASLLFVIYLLRGCN